MEPVRGKRRLMFIGLSEGGGLWGKSVWRAPKIKALLAYPSTDWQQSSSRQVRPPANPVAGEETPPHFAGLMLPLFRLACPSALLLFVTVEAMCAVVLSVDINDALDNPADTAPAFLDYVLADNTLTVGTYTVDINPASGAALADVHRLTPATGGALTLGALYRDCVFAAGDNTANFYRVGIDGVLTGLTPCKRYTLTVWSYDSGSTGARTSDWSVIGLGGPVFGINNYAFNGSVSPSSDTANRLAISALADDNGQLTLRGRPASQSATNQVFLNG